MKSQDSVATVCATLRGSIVNYVLLVIMGMPDELKIVQHVIAEEDLVTDEQDNV